MHVTSQQILDDGTAERSFTLGDIAGILWTPPSASAFDPVPLVMLGQPGGFGLQQMYPRLSARARSLAAHGFASATLELPGTGERAPLAGAQRARAELRRALAESTPPGEDLIDRLILPLVEVAVPEIQRALDEILDLGPIGERVGFSGGIIAIGTRLAVQDSRIAAAGLFAGSYVPRATMEEARRVTIPLHVLLQWDDEGNDRQRSLDLFDAYGSAQKTLYANMGGHRGVPAFAGEDAVRFFVRHLAE
ncbi:alpha/beta hydrolase [Microbacterium sp. NPDC091313]